MDYSRDMVDFTALIFLVAAVLGVGLGLIKPLTTESADRLNAKKYDKTVAMMQDGSGTEKTIVYANEEASYSMPYMWVVLQALVQDNGLPESKTIVMPNGSKYIVTGFYRDQQRGYAETVLGSLKGYGTGARFDVSIDDMGTSDPSDDVYRVTKVEGSVSRD